MRSFPVVWRVVLVTVVLMMLAGCNTIQGAGKDIKRAGEKIEEAARR